MAQLPAEAVQLDKVKIPEKQKAIDLCPVYLEPSDPNLPAWEYKGVGYRGSKPEAKDAFFKDPDKYAEAARDDRSHPELRATPRARSRWHLRGAGGFSVGRSEGARLWCERSRRIIRPRNFATERLSRSPRSRRAADDLTSLWGAFE